VRAQGKWHPASLTTGRLRVGLEAQIPVPETFECAAVVAAYVGAESLGGRDLRINNRGVLCRRQSLSDRPTVPLQ
jgi:hypothetical protein